MSGSSAIPRSRLVHTKNRWGLKGLLSLSGEASVLWAEESLMVLLFWTPLAVGGLTALAIDPCVGAVLGGLTFIVMVPVAFVRDYRRARRNRTRTPAVAFDQPKPEKPPKPRTKKELAAEARQALDDAVEAAALIPDDLTRKKFIAQAETRFRLRMAEIMS